MQCAQQVQAHLRAYNAEKESAEQIHVRIGIHLGDIIQPDGDVFGDGVNIAARLQALAEPDTICISQKVYEEVEKKSPWAQSSPWAAEAQEHCPAARVYILLSEPPKGLGQTLRVQRLKLKRWGRAVQLAGCGRMLLCGGLITVRASVPSPSTQDVRSVPHHAASCRCPTNPPSSSCPSTT